MKAKQTRFSNSRRIFWQIDGVRPRFADNLTAKTTSMLRSIVEHCKNIAPYAAVCLLMIASTAIASQQQQSLASIVMQAEAFIEQYDYQSPYPANIRIRPLDNRLRLQACFKPLEIGFTRADLTYGNTNLTVRCPTAPYWKILLPATITLYDDVMITRRPLLRGESLDPAIISVKKRKISGLQQGYFRQGVDVSHLQARRNLGAGIILTPNTVAPRLMVKSGQMVTIVLDYKGIAIKASGKALQSAKLGELVRVRNLQTSRVVEGIVQGEALVRINI